MPSAHLQGLGTSPRVRAYVAGGTTLLLLVSVAMNVVLARRLVAFVEPDAAPPILGMKAPALDVRGVDGQSVEIRFEGRPTILYYFSPNCSWCERNWTNVQALIAAVGHDYRFVGLSTTPDVSAYLAQHHLSFEVYSGLSLETARLYHFGGTPQTIVVAANGVVQYAWSGAYRDRRQRDVERAFGVVLPGLPDPVKH